MRSKKALFNLSANLLLQFVTALVGILLPRLMIEAYGSSINGMVSSINQFLRYLSLIEAGLGAASIAALYAPLASQQWGRLNAILSASHHFYRRVGYGFAGLVVLSSLLYPLLVHGQVPAITASMMVLILAGSGLVEYFVIGKYRVLLVADQKSYILSLIQTLGVILNAAVSILLIQAGFDVLITQSAAMLIFVSRVILVRGYVLRKYREVSYQATPDYQALDRRWDAFIHQLNNLIVNAAPILVITIFCSLKEVSVYAVFNMIFVAVNMFIAAFSTGLMASFGQLIANNDQETLRRSFGLYEYLYYGVLTWGYITAGVLILPFISIYTAGIQDAHYIRPELALLFVICGIVGNIRQPHYMLIQAAGHFRETKRQSLMESIIHLAASIALVQWLGVAGVLLGSLCAHLYRTPLLLYYAAKQILQGSLRHSMHRIIRIAVVSVMGMAPFMLLPLLQPTSWLEWILAACVISIGMLLVVISMNLIFERRTAVAAWKQVMAMYRSVLGRLKRNDQTDGT